MVTRQAVASTHVNAAQSCLKKSEQSLPPTTNHSQPLNMLTARPKMEYIYWNVPNAATVSQTKLTFKFKLSPITLAVIPARTHALQLFFAQLAQNPVWRPLPSFIFVGGGRRRVGYARLQKTLVFIVTSERSRTIEILIIMTYLLNFNTHLGRSAFEDLQGKFQRIENRDMFVFCI